MPQIRFGALREKVKSGELSARDVLKWARRQRGISPAFIGWLSRFDLETHKKRAEEDKERRKKKTSNK